MIGRGGLAVLALVVAGCVSSVPIEGAPCPCPALYCCENQVCVAKSICGAADGAVEVRDTRADARDASAETGDTTGETGREAAVGPDGGEKAGDAETLTNDGGHADKSEGDREDSGGDRSAASDGPPDDGTSDGDVSDASDVGSGDAADASDAASGDGADASDAPSGDAADASDMAIVDSAADGEGGHQDPGDSGHVVDGTAAGSPAYASAIVRVGRCAGVVLDEEWILTSTRCGLKEEIR
jgi:hypothetical protein